MKKRLDIERSPPTDSFTAYSQKPR